MDDLAIVLKAARETDDRPLALATIVNTKGSSYRRPGARLFVGERTAFGSISAGCLESDVKLHCRLGAASKGPVVIAYDPSQQNDIFGMPSGCGELIEVLLESLEGNSCLLDEVLCSLLTRARNYVAVTVISSSNIERVPLGLALVRSLSEERETWFSSRVGIDCAEQLFALARPVSKTTVLSDTVYGTAVRLLISFGSAVPRLAIFGSETDAVALAQMTSLLGWNATICDDRTSRLQALPAAVTTYGELPGQWNDWLQDVDATHAVIIFHDFERDRQALSAALASNVDFIAAVGPRRRTEKLLQAIACGDAALMQELVRRVHSPAGLDIGAERPGEIALALLSEIQAVRTGRSAGFLSSSGAPIHEPLARVEPATLHE